MTFSIEGYLNTGYLSTPYMTGVEGNNVGLQVRFVLYNVTQLRILYEFPSRGDGISWVADPSEKVGDYDVNNVNDDIIEHRYESQDGDKNVILYCSTLEPVFLDTLAILNHNLTPGASVTLQAATNAGFGTITISEVLTVTPENMYYIAPTIPLKSYSDWRLLINDPNNPDGNIKIGVIVFGSSAIFSPDRDFTLPMRYGKTHYKDTLRTEGYTTVSNDRAIRRNLTLNFNNIDVNGSTYSLIQNYLNTAKTDLKALVIPVPLKPDIASVFSKLSQLPEEEHNAIDINDQWLSNFTLSWDESL